MKVSRVDSSNLIIKDTPIYPGVVFLPVGVFGLYKLVERLSRSMDLDKEFFGMLTAIAMSWIAVGFMNELTGFHFNIGERTLHWKCWDYSAGRADPFFSAIFGRS
jgi:hypothetical protein